MALSTTTPATAAPALVAAVRLSRRLLLAAVGVGLLLRVAPLPDDVVAALALGFAAIGLLLGLPHGSLDHLLTARLSGWSAPVAAGVYAAIALAAWGLLVLVGPLALAAVLALSLLHFAQGEAEVQRAVTGWTPPRPVAAAAALAGTGALLLPLARVGDQLREVADAVTPGLGGLLAEPVVRLALAGGWCVAAAVTAIAAARAGRREVLGDLAIIALLGTLAPPLVAFGVWFGCWHGLRHLGRLMALEPTTARLEAHGDHRAAVRHLAALAAWPTLAAAGAAAVLVALTLADPEPTAALGRSLLVLLALTVPHMLVVLWIDAAGRRPGRLRPR
ncbi:hypothetical protein GCM10022215_41150 [Nocardioides fonticola]|uniref:Probable beta-carotene 15,15'-dioxygenase n=1 Tax=Nocardioides fonticola TaxID=450363 RepID=A0ABP7Y1E2_9ACTN